MENKIKFLFNKLKNIRLKNLKRNKKLKLISLKFIKKFR